MDVLANPYLHIAFNALISGGAFLSFVLAIATLFLQYPRRSVRYLTLLCFVMGITQLYAWFNFHTLFFHPPWLNYVFVGINFLIGPAVYFFYKSTGDETFSPDRIAHLAFAPGIFFTLLIPILNLVAPSLVPEDPRRFFVTGKPSLMDGIFTLAMLHNGVYYIRLFMVTWPQVAANKNIAPGARSAFLIFFGTITLINLYGIIAYLTRDIRHFYADSCIITLLIVAFLVFALRYPQYFLRVRPE
ncbi:MAG: hypothetical protein N2Z22_09300 [Turneriella sp.]|nr:hypothetical protein [Turneriella sp.]